MTSIGLGAIVVDGMTTWSIGGCSHTLALNKPTLKNKGGSTSNPLCRRNEDQGVLAQSCTKELVLFLLYRYENVQNKGNYTNRSE